MTREDWQTFDRWARYWARRYAWAARSYPHIDEEDLLQAARLGVLRAIDGYDPEKGAWATFSAYFIRTEILRECIGVKRDRLPPFLDSLNVPVYDEGEETRLDLLPDEDAPDPQERAEFETLRRGVQEAVGRLRNEQERTVVQMCYLDGKGQMEAAQALQVARSRVGQIFNRARRNLARDKRLRALWLEENTPFWARVGIQSFNTTWTSATEKAALWRLERSGKHDKQGSENPV